MSNLYKKNDPLPWEEAEKEEAAKSEKASGSMGDPHGKVGMKPAESKVIKRPPAPAPMRVRKIVVSMRIDSDLLDFFRDDEPGYQARINDALREYVNQQRKV